MARSGYARCCGGLHGRRSSRGSSARIRRKLSLNVARPRSNKHTVHHDAA